MHLTRSFRAVTAAVLLVAATAAVSGLIGFHTAGAAGSPAIVAPVSTAADRPLNSLRDLSNAFVEIARDVNPSVVTVFSERVMRARNPFGGLFGFQQDAPAQEFRQRGHGSGIVVSNDGYILTNNHVVQGADTIYVRTIDETQYAAKVIGVDPKTDIAVIKIDADGLTPIEIGDSDDLQVGEWVLAIGSPLSANLAQTVTQGIVSAKGRANVGLADYEDFIQTDAAINPGNSGGPLVNLDGRMVGINTAIVSRSGGFQGIGFAVPINMARNVMESLIKTGHVVRGWLGVSIQDITPSMSRALDLENTHGAIVGEVVEDSPADKAGFEEGDVIVALDNRDIQNSTELRNAVAETPPGTDVAVTVLRDNRSRVLDVTLGELPDDNAPIGGALEELLGFSVSPMTRDLAEKYGIDSRAQGVVVTEVDGTSAAYREGLREGDVILSVNRRRISSVGDFNSLLDGAAAGDDVLLRILRNRNSFYMAFTL